MPVTLGVQFSMPAGSKSAGGPGAGAAGGYTLNGRIICPVTLEPIEGINCTLMAGSLSGSSGVLQYTTETDAYGSYTFSDLPAGNYMLTSAKAGHMTDTSYFTVTRDMNMDFTSLKVEDWSLVMGTDHPYDATMAYVTAVVDRTGEGTPAVKDSITPKDFEKGGVTVDLHSNSGGKGANYEARCYFDAQGKADWSATSTTTTGVALFYRTRPVNTYTIKAAKTDHIFSDVKEVTAIKGQFTNYLINASDGSRKKQ
jgi:hypothetical protein